MLFRWGLGIVGWGVLCSWCPVWSKEEQVLVIILCTTDSTLWVLSRLLAYTTPARLSPTFSCDPVGLSRPSIVRQ